ncbi:uncharacterized protein LOC135961283 [Calliphora vicina]|uniref:uncharacterized protein LOC135961283 n=1 Tax=Calliphora vicina TaxID=7373 RepID=UPI00325B5631
MQRSPSRKSSRLQTATSQNVNSSTPAGTNSSANVSQMPSIQNVSSVALGTTTTVTSAFISAPREPTPAVSTQNIFSSTSEEPFSLPPLVPGPNVRTQPPQTISSDNENLQRQIDILQAQLANAQRALRANQNLNTPNVNGHNAPVIQSISSGPENMVDRRNPTPYSYVSQSDQLMTSQPLIVSPATVPMPVQRKLYDLPEFCGTPEDWPMFLSALEHSTAAYSYNNFENCLRLQKALKGEARECVKSLLIHPNNVPTVIEQLKLQYGRPELLIRCQLQQMKEVQPIAENVIDKLVPYSIKVRNLAAFLESANGYQHLSNPTLMEELVQKLPMSKRLDWAQFASTLPQLPTILDFSTWLQRVANLVRSVQISSLSGNRSSSDPKRKVVLYASDGPERQLKCFYCVGPHKIFDCKKFLELSVPNRWSEVKRLKLCFSCLSGGHSSKDCRRRKQCPMEKCQRNHNKLLHETKPNEPSERSVNVPPTERASTVEPVLSCVSSASERSHLLFRVLPVVLYGPNCAIETYALLDEGSSVTMMDSSLVRQLGLHGRQSQLNLSWYGGKSAQEPVMVVDLHVSGVNKKRKYALKNVYGVSNLKLPSQSFNADLVKNHGVPLNSYECVAPKVLIGLDHCHLGLPDEIVPLEDAGPYAANTPLGWVVFGNVKGGRPGTQTCLLTQLDNLNNLVANYFETENFGVKALPVIESRDDLRAREILRNSTKRVAGRFESRLLWCNDDVVLPDSYSMALNRFFGMERKMKNNPEFGAAYKQIMSEYLQKRYVRKLSLSEVDTFHPRTWYLPHFGVVNPNKPGKIRMVFDAAAKVEGVSLNSKLLKGPQQYKPLPSVLFNFRIGSVAVCGDIKEMFHQVVVAEEDRCSQRFLWRDDASGPPEVYEMLVMTFGAACSPCIAHYVKETNAMEHRNRFPRAVKSILDHHYVDDFVDCFVNPSKAIEIAIQVREIHKAAGFEMRKFTSNSSEVVVALEGCSDHQVSFSGGLNELEGSTEKVLGMFWDPKDDTFKFVLKFHRVNSDVILGKRCPTKRELLCVVMSIFDPLGFLCHFMITAKLLMREVWRHNVLWDEMLPASLQAMWNKWRQELRNVVHVKVPRFYFGNGLPLELELHVFVDASEDAFGAVGYWRYTTSDGQIGVSFISAKSKCAPLKCMTIPRLELQAAVLGTRLMDTIMKEHELKVSRRICWSDSTTVISWIGSESRRYKPFVAHRIAEILDSTRPTDWRWLPTDLNVADDTTRAKNEVDFSIETRWFQGPQFLYENEADWPNKNSEKSDDLCEEELRPKFVMLVSTNLVIDFNRFSSFLRLKRTMAWVLRFINHCRNCDKCNGSRCLCAEELRVAETSLCRLSQEECFAFEINVLKSDGSLKKDNVLFSLSPYFDENNLLRVSGRIDAASWLPLDARHPIILSPCHRFTQLFVAHVHNKMRHQNFEATIGEIRKRFWIPRLRNLLSKTTSNCNICKIRRAVPVAPFMGSLPSDRLTPYVRPFTYTGVDYFGPLNVTVGRRHEKRWVALFTCLTIRAVHLEVAYDLSTDSCILAIRNFINRRGTPLKIRSDNGKNFVGVNQEAQRFDEVFDLVKIEDELSTRGIEWQFNCPHNPAEGGIWERMVQCVKKVLRVTLKEVAPKEHTLQSFLIEAENIVNSRPLTHLPVSPEDEEPLTPNHFLLGSANTAQTPEGIEITKPVVLKKQWRIARQLRDHFWKRWVVEYLPTLTRRSKWCEHTKPVAPGDLLLICDPAVSRRDWKRGRVVNVFPGSDGVIRRADVQTSSGILKRPVSKLAVLDLE